MIGFLLPLPYLMLMAYSAAVPNGKNRHIGYLGALAGLVTLALTILAWYSPSATSATWFSLDDLVVKWTVLLDPISLLLAGIVSGIGTFVFLYGTAYFQENEDLRRYYILLSLFASSMIAVVTSGNLVQLFLSWELVGVSSFLLIGFWHHKRSAVQAARKAFITIIIGDAIFLAGLIALWHSTGTLEITEILGGLEYSHLTLVAGIGIVAGAISKSAQFPMHDWLPDAMEGPTPVSAFLHSATMVKAGLFLVARFLPLLAVAGLLPWLTLIAVITIIISATIALVENDIKRVLAYSTMNHLAIILLALSTGALAAGMFHLFTHSIFKALLFFSAGIAIHVTGSQDLQKMSIKPRLDVFTIGTVAGVLALSGVIPFAGFFSKEVIFEMLVHDSLLVAIFSITIVLSAAYSFRWLFLLFGRHGRDAHSRWEMSSPLAFLGLFSLLAGALMWWLFPFFGERVPHVFSGLTLVSIMLVLLGILGPWLIYIRGKDVHWLLDNPLLEFLRERYLVPRGYDLIGRAYAAFSRFLYWLDGALINRMVRLAGSSSLALAQGMRRMHSGMIATYVIALIIGFLSLLILAGWWL